MTFVDLLRDAGYDTALIGKSHLQNFTGTAALSKPAPARDGYRQPSPGLRQAMRIDLTGKRYGQEQPAYWAEPGAHIETPFYGYGHVELVTGHGDAVGGDYRAWLREKDPAALDLLGTREQPAARLCGAAGLSHAHSGGTVFDDYIWRARARPF